MSHAMTKLGSKIGTVAIAAVLLGLLAASVWFAAHSWTSVEGPPMPASGYIAMTLGVVFSILIGSGLMALVFYSNRYGYDDEANDQRSADNESSRTRQGR
jgi:hypothetical protein